MPCPLNSRSVNLTNAGFRLIRFRRFRLFDECIKIRSIGAPLMVITPRLKTRKASTDFGEFLSGNPRSLQSIAIEGVAVPRLFL